MDWYYANNGQQAGPVSEGQLDQLAQSGTITPATLVWREGLATWQSYSVARPQPGASPPSFLPPVIDQQRCVECQRTFPTNDLLRYENVHVCAECKPMFFQKLREGVATGTTAGLWRQGKLLVMRKEAVLPDRCVKCNSPANGFRLKRNLSWHSPWLFLLLVAAWLIYLIVALVVSKRAKIEIGLCALHKRIRKRDLLIAWLIFALSLGAFGLSIALSNGWYALVGVGLLLASLIYGVTRVPMVQPKRIDHQFVWLNGVSRDYLAELPEFTGPN